MIIIDWIKSIPIELFVKASTAERFTNFIPSLFFLGSPSGIIFTIMSVIVGVSVYLSIFFTKLSNVPKIGFVHILLKITKRLPIILYPTPAVSSIILVFRITRSAFDVAVNIIKTCVAHVVLSISVPSILSAPATFGATRSKAFLQDFRFLSTGAFTRPVGSTGYTRLMFANNCKSSKYHVV